MTQSRTSNTFPRTWPAVLRGGLPRWDRDSRRWLVLPLGLALLSLGWAAVVLLVSDASFVLLDPRTKTGFEVLLAAASLFAALVLLLLPDETVREPLRWVALGFVLLGLGSLGFGYLYPALVETLSLREGMYASLFVRTAAAAALAAGLALPAPFRLTRRMFLAITAGSIGGGMLVLALAHDFARLTTLDALSEDISGTGPLEGLTAEHWALSLVPLALASIAALGAIYRYAHVSIVRWLAPALVLFAGSQLHAMLWPAGFNPAFTTSSGLRVAFTVIVTIGVIVELRNIAAERAALLAQERTYTRRLEDLALLRADFTAMVAHELSSPLAGIRRSAEVIDPVLLPLKEQRALETIQFESAALAALVDDVQASARAERDDFRVRPRPVPVEEIIREAACYARGIAGDHRINVFIAAQGKVMADPDRTGQVLRNLLSNAMKFSPSDVPVDIRATSTSGRKVRFEVVDRGSGIHPDDMARIFEKFGRGRAPQEADAGQVPGVGLGLYLSRRIIQASGSELMVASEPGRETRFWFDLEQIS